MQKYKINPDLYKFFNILFQYAYHYYSNDDDNAKKKKKYKEIII